MMEQAVVVMMTSEVDDDQTGRRHEQDRSDMVARDRISEGRSAVLKFVKIRLWVWPSVECYFELLIIHKLLVYGCLP